MLQINIRFFIHTDLFFTNTGSFFTWKRIKDHYPVSVAAEMLFRFLNAVTAARFFFYRLLYQH
jgi:hypothetical protein